MSAHCQLESIPGLEFLQCAVDAHGSGETADGCDSGCCELEKLQYQSGHARITIPTPDSLPLLPLVWTAAAHARSVFTGFLAVATAPPELPPGWQFVFRTAAPPRAPSLAS